MSNKYTEQENKELNQELKKLQQRASRLILNDYYDCVHLSELQYSALKSITNAKSHNDINWYLWNSGLLQSTLDYISDKIKEAKRGDR